MTEYNEGDVTVIEIEGDMIDAARSPEEPEYQPSAYELEVAARHKKIEDKPPKKRQEKVSFIMLSLDYLILLLTYFTLFFTARQSGRCYTNKKNEEINCPPIGKMNAFIEATTPEEIDYMDPANYAVEQYTSHKVTNKKGTGGFELRTRWSRFDQSRKFFRCSKVQLDSES